ncbi:PLP-dependent aminotransferase family protein [Alicyclobacillus fastidiosus]|uniref:aminotransferase-like domain-containing protein n=1 Tax=Alicyclobacillus fastidiosus TaxID=392011 RepID=UPI0023E98574|nr:PLP-dependent aminotransferase family protein [Alicyclobacillus fastidiosus]GMA61044.1 GntR family transcriptional regulator [Alicyclobacillus fastidiosus]
MIDFARGELASDLFPVKQLNELIHHLHLVEPLGYSVPKGLEGLREVLAQHVHAQYNMKTTSSEILITSGAQQALHLITSCLLRSGDAVALECPSYAYSLSLFTSAGLRLFPIPMDEYGVIPESIPDLVKRHRIRMVFINPTFQNPTGTTLPVHRRRELLRICESLRLPVVEDDPYGELALDEQVPVAPLAALPEAFGKVVYLGSLSKTIAPGLRIGWVIGPKNVIDRLADAKEQMDFGTSVISQLIAQEFLQSGAWQDNVLSLRRILKQRRNRMLAALEENLKELMTWTIPQGSYHVWCQLSSKVKDTDLLDACIRRGVVVLPGGVYGADRGFIRLTYARALEEEIEEGVVRLRLALESLVL